MDIPFEKWSKKNLVDFLHFVDGEVLQKALLEYEGWLRGD